MIKLKLKSDSNKIFLMVRSANLALIFAWELKTSHFQYSLLGSSNPTDILGYKTERDTHLYNLAICKCKNSKITRSFHFTLFFQMKLGINQDFCLQIIESNNG